MNKRFCALIALAGLMAASGIAAAQQFPSRPVTYIIPWAPGGSSDATARMLAQTTSKYLGQQVIIENRPGVGGVAGANTLATTRPDGYTVAQIPLGVFRVPHQQAAQYDVRDFAYLMNISGFEFGLIVPADSPFRNLAEVVDFARTNPGKLSYGTPGAYSTPHVIMEALAIKAGVQFNHIPFKGSAPQLQAVLGGHIMAGNGASDFAPQVDAGKLRLLVTWGDRRTKHWPAVPTVKESGYDISTRAEYGLATAKGTDPAILKVLHDAFKKGLEDPEHVASLAKFEQEVIYMSPEDYRRFALATFENERALVEAIKKREAK
jgi:tripartite-type tricarboxylate transporter receptor subunit TctC